MVFISSLDESPVELPNGFEDAAQHPQGVLSQRFLKGASSVFIQDVDWVSAMVFRVAEIDFINGEVSPSWRELAVSTA